MENLGQVFTPQLVVEEMLNNVGYMSDNENILVQKIIEPSFGEGVFLEEIIRRLIIVGEKQNLSKKQLGEIISRNVWGIEYDKKLFDETCVRIRKFLEEKKIFVDKFNFFNEDALGFLTDETFDYVVGNPPYVRVHNMNETVRKNAKSFVLAHGTTDLYVIFFELGLKLLNSNGKLVYITPNSWLKNTSQKELRKLLLKNNFVEKITDFGSNIVFENASIYTAITYLNKQKNDTKFVYELQDVNKLCNITVLDITDFPADGSPWVLGKNDDFVFLKNLYNKKNVMSDFLNVQYGVLTLRNHIYLNFDELSVEKGVVKPVVKASTFKGGEVLDKIIFPYELNVNERFVPLNENVFENMYPNGYKHLLSHKEELLTRDSDKGSEWFQYGRSQGLTNMFKEKLVFNHIVSANDDVINFWKLDADVVVYSGIFITAVPGLLTLEEIRNILESENFCYYAKLAGKNKSGNFRELSAKIVKNFRF